MGLVQSTKWSLAMMSEFLHLNPLCGSKHTSFLTLSRDHKSILHVHRTVLGQMRTFFFFLLFVCSVQKCIPELLFSCGPSDFLAGRFPASFVPQDGCPILHCQGQG